MIKILKKIFLSLFLFSIFCFILSGCATQKKMDVGGNETISIGNYYIFENYNNAVVKAYYSTGEEIEVQNNKFLPLQLGEYKLTYSVFKGKKVTKYGEKMLTVVEGSKPFLFVKAETNVDNAVKGVNIGAVGKTFILPKIEARDTLGEKLIPEIFVITNKNDFSSKITLTDIKIDNVSHKSFMPEEGVKYYIHATVENARKISNFLLIELFIKTKNEIDTFDCEDYVNEWQKMGDSNFSFNSEKKFIKKGNGSVKVTGYYNATLGFPGIKLPVPNQTDLTDFNGIEFYIYNNSNRNLKAATLSAGSENSYFGTIYSKMWTKFTITKAELLAMRGWASDSYIEKDFKNFIISIESVAGYEVECYIDEIMLIKGDVPTIEIAEKEQQLFSDMKEPVSFQNFNVNFNNPTKKYDVFLNGIRIESDNNGFLPTAEGKYEILCTAYNEDLFVQESYAAYITDTTADGDSINRCIALKSVITQNYDKTYLKGDSSTRSIKILFEDWFPNNDFNFNWGESEVVVFDIFVTTSNGGEGFKLQNMITGDYITDTIEIGVWTKVVITNASLSNSYNIGLGKIYTKYADKGYALYIDNIKFDPDTDTINNITTEDKNLVNILANSNKNYLHGNDSINSIKVLFGWNDANKKANFNFNWQNNTSVTFDIYAESSDEALTSLTLQTTSSEMGKELANISIKEWKTITLNKSALENSNIFIKDRMHGKEYYLYIDNIKFS